MQYFSSIFWWSLGSMGTLLAHTIWTRWTSHLNKMNLPYRNNGHPQKNLFLSWNDAIISLQSFDHHWAPWERSSQLHTARLAARALEEELRFVLVDATLKINTCQAEPSSQGQANNHHLFLCQLARRAFIIAAYMYVPPQRLWSTSASRSSFNTTRHMIDEALRVSPDTRLRSILRSHRIARSKYFQKEL